MYYTHTALSHVCVCIVGDEFDDVRSYELRAAAQEMSRRKALGEVRAEARDVEQVLAGGGAGINDGYSRARTPYSNGFLFTVRPELKTEVKKPRKVESTGGKVQLEKKMKELKAEGSRVRGR